MYQIWQKEWDETVLVSNKFHEILPTFSGKLLSFCNTKEEDSVLSKLHIGQSHKTHFFILKKKKRRLFVL